MSLARAASTGRVENAHVHEPAVDFHQHLWPEPFIAALSRRQSPPRLRRSTLELAGSSGDVDLATHTLETRVALLDRDELDVGVVSLSPALGIDDLPEEEAGELRDAYEDGILELASVSKGRLVPLAATMRDGFAGKCVSAAQLLDAETATSDFDELERRGSFLFVHPGPAAPSPSRPTWWGEVVDYTAQMQEAYASWLAEGARRWPTLQVVFAILAGGGPFQLERLSSRGLDTRDVLHTNVHFETASYGKRAIELCLSTFGVGHVVYGSDVPVIDSKPTLDAVRSFGDPVADALCRQNPARLLA
jgi:6-methylsalicylate decarboxylase